MTRRENQLTLEASGVYLIINPKGRKYVGQTKNFKKRYTSYMQTSWLKDERSKSKIKYSFAKYGAENHHFEILEEVDVSMLSEREEWWILRLNTMKNGLNTIDRNYTIFEFKGGTTKWDEERKKSHSKSIKKRHQEGCYKNRDYTKLSKARKGIVTAWDKQEEKFVSIKKEEFDTNDRYVGTTSKEIPGAKTKNKKPIKDLRTGIVYGGVKECMRLLGKSSTFIYHGLKKGHFEYC